ncbi:MAG: TlpA disulfide reductase family protein [Gemmatimonadota bacterium]
MNGAARTWLGRVAAGVAFGAACAGPAAAQHVGIAIGEVPEAVLLEDLEGNPVSLGEYIGQGPALVQFWATWCEVCAALEPRLRVAAETWGEDVDFVLVAVGVNQNPRRIRRYMSRHPLHGRVLWDGRGRATRAFMAPTTGFLVLLDREGRVVYTGVGEDQEFEPAIARVLKE